MGAAHVRNILVEIGERQLVQICSRHDGGMASEWGGQ